MSELYACNKQPCENDLGLYYLDEVIEHLRARHKLIIHTTPIRARDLGQPRKPLLLLSLRG
jgi:hypothetical protein